MVSFGGRAAFIGGRRQRLSPVDTAWFRMEQRETPADIVALMAFDGEVDEVRLREVIEERLLVHPKFRCRVAESRLSMARPRWTEETRFSLGDHLARVRVEPGAGRFDPYVALASYINEPTDFTRSPWKAWHVSGAPGGSLLLVRVHHCMGDGFALLDLLLRVADPDGQPEHGAARHLPRHARRRALTKALALLRETPRGLVDLGHLVSLPFDRPSRLRRKPAGERRVAASNGVPLTRVKALAHAYGATVNDVLLAALAGALGRYLALRGDSASAFRAIVPVNLRPHSEPIDEQHGNWFGLVYVDLPLAEPDREARLGRIRQSVARIKASHEPGLSLALMNLLGRVPGAIEHVVDEFFARKATVVVTNVPGPRKPLFVAGRRVRDLVFWAPHPSGLSCGASILSYAGTVRVGIRTDGAVVRDPELIARYFDDELTAWEGNLRAAHA
jgi:diacylglycerol O-acyltransferase